MGAGGLVHARTHTQHLVSQFTDIKLMETSKWKKLEKDKLQKG